MREAQSLISFLCSGKIQGRYAASTTTLDRINLERSEATFGHIPWDQEEEGEGGRKGGKEGRREDRAPGTEFYLLGRHRHRDTRYPR